MKKDPYVEILMMMQKEGAKSNPPSICLGEIVSVSPLRIKVDELILEPDDFLIADFLIEGYKRDLKVTSNGEMKNEGNLSIRGTLTSETQYKSGGSGEAAFATHNHPINNAATLIGTVKSSGNYGLTGESEVELKAYLKKGDLLALMPMYGEQLYIVLCKVVSLV